MSRNVNYVGRMQKNLEVGKLERKAYLTLIFNFKLRQIGFSLEVQGGSAEEEQKWGAYHVEIYKCQKCDTNVRFPRYNDPVKLLETRLFGVLFLCFFVLFM